MRQSDLYYNNYTIYYLLDTLIEGVCINYERLDRMREIELKHARIAMIAALGWPLSELRQPDSISMRITRFIALFLFGQQSGDEPGLRVDSSNTEKHLSVVSGELFLVVCFFFHYVLIICSSGFTLIPFHFIPLLACLHTFLFTEDGYWNVFRYFFCIRVLRFSKSRLPQPK